MCTYLPENIGKPTKIAEGYTFPPTNLKPSLGEYKNLWMLQER